MTKLYSSDKDLPRYGFSASQHFLGANKITSLLSSSTTATCSKDNVNRTKRKHLNIISKHPYNRAMDVFVPHVTAADVLNLLQIGKSQCRFAIAKHVPLSAFLDEGFRERYLGGNGMFTAISLHTAIDTATVVAVTPGGELILSVDRDTYHQLGIVGTASKHQPQMRWIIRIDLTLPSFIPGRKFYERCRWCFQDRLDLSFSFAMTWTKYDNIQGSDWCDDISFGADIEVKMVDLDTTTFDFTCIPIPRLPDAAIPFDLAAALRINEWFGMRALRINEPDGPPNEFLSDMECPSPFDVDSYGTSLRTEGMVSVAHIQNVIERIRSLVDSDQRVPWAAITVWGFEDAPISWGNDEHGYGFGGENAYTIIIFPSNANKQAVGWVFLTRGTNDPHHAI